VGIEEDIDIKCGLEVWIHEWLNVTVYHCYDVDVSMFIFVDRYQLPALRAAKLRVI
jgi:hypothetical protein